MELFDRMIDASNRGLRKFAERPTILASNKKINKKQQQNNNNNNNNSSTPAVSSSSANAAASSNAPTSVSASVKNVNSVPMSVSPPAASTTDAEKKKKQQSGVVSDQTTATSGNSSANNSAPATEITLKLNEVAYHCIIKACLKHERFDRALLYAEDMRTRGLNSDHVFFYTSVIEAVGRHRSLNLAIM